jgi:hypothetical protein
MAQCYFPLGAVKLNEGQYSTLTASWYFRDTEDTRNRQVLYQQGIRIYANHKDATPFETDKLVPGPTMNNIVNGSVVDEFDIEA